MGIIILIIIGGVLGWLASLVMRTDGQQGMFLNVIVGIVGALIAGFLINPLIGGGNIMNGDYSFSSLVVSFLVPLCCLRSSTCFGVVRSVRIDR